MRKVLAITVALMIAAVVLSPAMGYTIQSAGNQSYSVQSEKTNYTISAGTPGHALTLETVPGKTTPSAAVQVTRVPYSFKPGGAYLWTKASPLYDPGGKLIGAIETMRDVTEHRQIEQKLERSKAELQIAAEIQKNFLPDHTPSVFQFKLAAVTIPAMEVGGDFYDFISLPDGRQGLVIADVAGKSIPAALFMALSRTIVRANAAHQPQTAEVLREANNMIAEDASAGMFVTLFYGILDGKAHTLTYANAGHPPLLVFRTGGCRCTEQEVTGVALGAMDGMEYEERQVQFLPGDVAVLYTDGVTEAVNRKGEMYGLKRLCSVMTRNGHLSAQEIMEKVLDDISEFSGDQSQYDDITLVVLKAE